MAKRREGEKEREREERLENKRERERKRVRGERRVRGVRARDRESERVRRGQTAPLIVGCFILLLLGNWGGV